MIDVILVTHKNMMTASGTHLQGLHSTQVRHHTQIDLLTCRVYFVKQGRAASGGASAPGPLRAHWNGPEQGGTGRGELCGPSPECFPSLGGRYLPSGDGPHNSGPLQWARGKRRGVSPGVAARP